MVLSYLKIEYLPCYPQKKAKVGDGPLLSFMQVFFKLSTDKQHPNDLKELVTNAHFWALPDLLKKDLWGQSLKIRICNKLPG